MSKLSKHELIDRLDTMLIRTCADCDEHEPSQIAEEIKEKIRQAYEQIKSILQSHVEPDEAFVEKWADIFCLRSGELFNPKSIAKDISQMLSEAPMRKPRVSRELIKTHARHMVINTFYNDNDQKRGKISTGEYPDVEKALVKFAQEAGMEVEDKCTY